MACNSSRTIPSPTHTPTTPNQFSTVNKRFAWGPNQDNRNQVFVTNTIYEVAHRQRKAVYGRFRPCYGPCRRRLADHQHHHLRYRSTVDSEHRRMRSSHGHRPLPSEHWPPTQASYRRHAHCHCARTGSHPLLRSPILSPTKSASILVRSRGQSPVRSSFRLAVRSAMLEFIPIAVRMPSTMTWRCRRPLRLPSASRRSSASMPTTYLTILC